MDLLNDQYYPNVSFYLHNATSYTFVQYVKVNMRQIRNLFTLYMFDHYYYGHTYVLELCYRILLGELYHIHVFGCVRVLINY